VIAQPPQFFGIFTVVRSSTSVKKEVGGQQGTLIIFLFFSVFLTLSSRVSLCLCHRENIALIAALISPLSFWLPPPPLLVYLVDALVQVG